MPKTVSKRNRIASLRKQSEKGAIPDICSRDRTWEPVPGRLHVIRTTTNLSGGGRHRIVCHYDADVPVICAAPTLFDLVERFVSTDHGPEEIAAIRDEMKDVIIATREMALERWENKTSGMTAARKMHSLPASERKAPRRLQPGELAPKKATPQEKVDVVSEISNLKKGL